MKKVLVALVVVGAILIGGSFVLRGSDPRGPREAIQEEGGLSSSEPVSPAPGSSGLASLRSAEVRAEGSTIVFEAHGRRAIPRALQDGSMSWRWEIRHGSRVLWILSASLDVGPNASLFNPATDVGVGTIDGSFPGAVERDGDSLVVRLRPDELESFPRQFEWVLTTTLDEKGIPGSTPTKDRVPEQGSLRFPAD